MNAPLIWIVFPLFVSLILIILRTYRFTVVIIATSACLLLAILAWLLPIDALIRLGPVTAEISSVMSLLGRKFILNDGDRFLLTFLYGIGALWFFGEGVIQKNSNFAPFGLIILTLSIAALAVQPFLYAALIIEIAVLISIPLLLPSGTRVGQGVLRYLIFQTIAMALILFAGWASGRVEANPADSAISIQALVFLGLGFAFWLAVFPFYTWIPLLVSEVFPYQAGFLLNFLPQVILLLALDFLNAFAWLRQFPDLQDVLRLSGVLMVATGGIWAAFQHDLSRLMGYAAIVEIGFSLLALSLQSRIGFELYVAMFLPRLLALALWSMVLSTLDLKKFDFDQIAGLAYKKPIEGISVVVASFTLAGLPLLGVFPLRQVLFENLAQQSLLAVIWSLVGNLGLLIASVRILMIVITSTDRETPISEDWRQAGLLVVGVLVLVILGIMPEWFLSSMSNLLNAFGNLTRL